MLTLSRNVLSHGRTDVPPAARTFLEELVRLGLLEPAALAAFIGEREERLSEYTTEERIAGALVQAGLLTEYQVNNVLLGQTHGMVLGSYRVLEHLGNGGMGGVFLAEHRLLKRRVAVKILPMDDECPEAIRQRFYAEMRVLAGLHHPNVVTAYDGGEVPPRGPNMPGLVYLVMEWIDGGDLERHVRTHGPCEAAVACNYLHQAARGLQAVHDRHLVHRDIKPSNLVLDKHGQVKLVDFGLARQFCSRLTDPRVLLGSVEFMPPEQSHDPSSVGKEADIYGLGATLFWLLTGEPPYPYLPNISRALQALQRETPRKLRQLRPDAPAELEALIEEMLNRNPAKRPPTALAVINALLAFLGHDPEEMRQTNHLLQQSLESQAADVRRAHDALLFAMAKMAESRHGETPGHLRRLQCYTRVLARQVALDPWWSGLVDDRFIAQLERCVPLHDIGKLGLPDEVLLKRGTLDVTERLLVETHPLIGDRMLEALAREHGDSLEFLGMARVIVRHHHERFDGKGYPDRLSGDAIPPAARLVAVADVYDALRRERLHKPAMSHASAIETMLHYSPGQFDPSLLRALFACQEAFENIYRDVCDSQPPVIPGASGKYV
jgi:response regulator RpfG family c-di-GMP phosphodiesterase/tRNA A-37 threonylcarbamoyl transferase component Bud32